MAPARVDGLPVPPERRWKNVGPDSGGTGKRPSLPRNGPAEAKAKEGPPGERYNPGPTTTRFSTASKRPTGGRRKPERPGRPGSRFPPGTRTNSATTRRRGSEEFGLDVARAVLGHASPVVTEVYAELDGAKAAEAMERVG